MTISYSDFLTQVRNYTEVESNVLSDTLLDQFIRNTELDIASKVDYDDLRKYATSTTNTNSRFILLPDDLIYLRSVQTIISGERNFLEKRDTSFIAEYNGSGSTGQPKYYANWNESTIILAPTPDVDTYTIQINYIIDPPHFTSTNVTYLSTYQESLLLNGVLTEAFRFLKGPADLYKVYFDKYNEEVQAFALQQMGQRRRGQYEDGVPRIQISSPSA
tara:strand:+ start:2599 stop:3252 length:654 start_codon:yes stop_codon:yes gene_type:complete